MAKAQLQPVMSYLRRVVQAPDASRVPDAQLLERFVTYREEAAFELLVWRHDRMVLGVCQRMLRDREDIEDAFQATFLILARKARSIGKRESVASWLYKVGFRCALRAKAGARKRTAREKHGIDLSTAPARSEPTADMVWRDLRPVLDQEINSLPEKYRQSVVLCYLEGKTYGEAAAQLGCSVGTISTRLTRARELLRTGLARHGLVLSGGALSLALCAHAASAAVPAALVNSTVAAALLFAAGEVATGALSRDAAILAQGVLKTMLTNKLKVAALFLLAVGAPGAAGFLAHEVLARCESDTGPKKTPPAQIREETKPREDLKQFAAVVLSNTQPVGADDRSKPDVTLAKGTRAHAFKLAKDEKLAESIRPGVMVDVIAEISEPIETAVPAAFHALENVKLLAIDMDAVGNRTLTVQVTPTQEKVLVLLEEDGANLRVKLHDAKTPQAQARESVKGDPAPKEDDEVSVQTAQPVVVRTVPQAGATDVDPKTAEIKVTFSKDMQDGSWSWSQLSKESFPEIIGKPSYLKDKRTCVVKVKLEPGKTYAIWLNSENFHNFKDADGRPAVPYLLVFETAK